MDKSRSAIAATADAARVEAPVTVKAYLMCAFAAFGGIFFGYDSGYINGVMGMSYFIQTLEGLVGLPLSIREMDGRWHA